MSYGAYGFERQIAANKAKTTMLMLFFIAFMALLGWAAGYLIVPVEEGATQGEQAAMEATTGIFIMAFFILVAIISTGVSFWFSDSIITKMVNARPANPNVYEERMFIDYIDGLVLACGLPDTPKAYVIESDALNAFATGRDPQHSLIAVTTGMLHKLERQELEGVIAHEMSHIYNRDILLMGVAAVLVGGISMFCHVMLRVLFWGGSGKGDRKGGGSGALMLIGIVFMILAPIFANLLNMMLSRKREYLADATAVRLTRNPEGLVNALNKISVSGEKMPFVEKELNAMFIDHPQKARTGRSWWHGIWSTHPPIEDRIHALKSM
jgi:heat shock protein HtpX